MTGGPATADLLRREGYDVDAVSDGESALEKVRATPYDLLISDLEMPGNEDLALVKEVATVAGGLPIIIVTGFPSTGSAIASIELPVSAYLLKPVNFTELLARIDAAVSRYRSYQAMRRAEARLEKWREDFQHIAEAPGAPGVDAFLALTLRNVMGSLTDLELLGRIIDGLPADAPLVVAGDFNDWRQRAHRVLERRAGLCEVFVHAHGRAAKTFPARFPVLQLDRIYVKNVRTHAPVALPRRPWSHLSDHAPLAAEITP